MDKLQTWGIQPVNQLSFGERLAGLWKLIEGTPTMSTVSEKPVTVEFVMPAGGGYPFSRHAMTLFRRRTTVSWPRPWKRDVVVAGYDIMLDEPPAVPAQGLAKAVGRKTDGIYGMFIKNASSVQDAMDQYQVAVLRARQ